jgi:hypothetical protein
MVFPFGNQGIIQKVEKKPYAHDWTSRIESPVEMKSIF